MRTPFLVLIDFSLTDNSLAIADGSEIYINNDPCFINFRLCMSKLLTENEKKGCENEDLKMKENTKFYPSIFFSRDNFDQFLPKPSLFCHK